MEKGEIWTKSTHYTFSEACLIPSTHIYMLDELPTPDTKILFSRFELPTYGAHSSNSHPPLEFSPTSELASRTNGFHVTKGDV
jgi:hypothetical protein